MYVKIKKQFILFYIPSHLIFVTFFNQIKEKLIVEISENEKLLLNFISHLFLKL